MVREIVTKQIIKILILISILGIGAGQFIFLFSVQSKVIWRFDGVSSGSSPWGGELTFNVPSNSLASNKYVIKVSESFSFIGQFERGNITFLHLASSQSFFFEYYLGESSLKGTESESETWILPSGMYNITWNNDDSSPHYKLIAASFFYPLDEIVILVSGLSALICVIGVIGAFIRIIKKRE